jgi:molecular chaperone GrpE
MKMEKNMHEHDKHKHEHSEEKHNNVNKKETENKVEVQNNRSEDKKNIENILAEKDKKINELTDKYLRSLAELDNFRKRIAKEKQEFEKNTKAEAINIFLSVLDNLERATAVAEATKDIESLKKGIEMIIKQFKDILKEINVKEINTEGFFNPEFHHALHKEYVEGKKEGEILEVYQRGYMLDNKIIRPALVKVAYIPEDKNKSEEKKHE